MKTFVKPLALILSLLMLFGCAAQPGSEEPTTEATEAGTATEPTQAQTEATQVTEPVDDTPKVSIRFFSVENVDSWGDCTYIEFPNGENMLIDTGLPAATAQIVDELLDLGIDHIDHLVLTHSHADHVKGVSSVLANMKVERAYHTGYWTTDFTWVLRDLKGRGVEETILLAGDSFSVGDVKFDILWPTAEDVAGGCSGSTKVEIGPGSTVDVNNKSMVFMMTYGDNSVLFTGDMYTAGQNDILAKYADDLSVLNADILKIAHHGYDNAGNEKFVATVSPEYAVSMGTMTMNSSVYKHYSSIGCTTYFSWMNGNVYVTMDGTSITVTPDDPTILDYYLTGSAGSSEGDEEIDG